MSKRDDRLTQIVNLLKIREHCSIKELSSVFNVSEMTIRRDLKVIEASSIANVINGVVIYNPAQTALNSTEDYNIILEGEKHRAEKKAVGRYAASLVNPNDIIILDTGTTTVRIAENLPQNIPLTVLCYNINILMELYRLPNVDILLAGGHYYRNTQMFQSPQGLDYIKNTRAHKVFISVAGIHEDLGLTCCHDNEIETKRAILNSALEKILVTDSSKFGQVHSSHFCDLTDIDMIITDKNLESEWVRRIHELNIKLRLV